jgi:predicted metal-dependent enzyme (double-stranded beta helix superfamily)
MTTRRMPAFQKFIDDIRAAFKEGPDTAAAMEKTRVLLEGLVGDEDLRARSKDWPSTEGHKNLLLYEDPDYGFAINAVVRTPNRKGGIHDHAHAWTAYGLLDGVEKLERYTRLDDGAKEGYAELRLDSVTEGGPGTVDLVPPFDIHSEKGGAGRSVAVIVRSERVAGRVLQGRFDPEANTTNQGEGPTQVPFELAEAG